MNPTTTTLNQIADITAGLHFRTGVSNDPTGNVVLIQIKDITRDLGLRMDSLTRVHFNHFEPYVVRQNDVLFVARGSRFGAVLIEEPLQNAIATGSFFVLRPRRDVLPAFLRWAINSAPVQSQLERAKQGSGLPMVPRREIETLLLDVPPVETQRAIVRLDQLKREEAQIMAQLLQKRAQFVDALTLELARQDLKP